MLFRICINDLNGVRLCFLLPNSMSDPIYYQVSHIRSLQHVEKTTVRSFLDFNLTHLEGLSSETTCPLQGITALSYARCKK